MSRFGRSFSHHPLHRRPPGLDARQTTRLALLAAPLPRQPPPQRSAQVFCVSKRRGPTRGQCLSGSALHRPHLLRGRAGSEARALSVNRLGSKDAHTQRQAGCSTHTPDHKSDLINMLLPPPRPCLHQQMHVGHPSR